MFGKTFNAAYGPTDYELVTLSGAEFGGGCLIKFHVRPEYTERNYAVFVNGGYAGVASCALAFFQIFAAVFSLNKSVMPK